MPLSDFGLTQNSQVFQVFGTKRKHEWSEIEGDHGDIQMEAAAKRMCPQPTESGDAMNEMLEINHNSIPLAAAPQQNGIHPTLDSAILNQQHIQQLQQQQQLHQYVPQQQQSEEVQEILNQQIQPAPEASEQHNTMVMDLCDETYSNVQLDQETQDMYSNMDSDCVPDLQQYGLAFCGDMCVGGDRSPTSGRIRCYCKPSWEGLMEMRPYVSDYY